MTQTAIHRIDPLSDGRWLPLLKRHEQASIFHSPGWLEALRRTYRYHPFALTTSAESEPLANALLACRVTSPLTGDRVVSLPFSDHCDALVGSAEQLHQLSSALQEMVQRDHLRYAEMRPLGGNLAPGNSFLEERPFWMHTIDLRPELDEVYKRVHKSCVQRKIRRAQREDVRCESGRSQELLEAFFMLFLESRRRQKLAPQPVSWFQNLVDCLQANLTIRVATKNRRPVASIITLNWGDCMYYKYGCSDPQYRPIGAMQRLFWSAICDAKEQRMQSFDLGRSDLDNPGLIDFKDRLGASRRKVSYWRHTASTASGFESLWHSAALGHMISRLPDALMTRCGSLLYRHIG